MIIAPSLLAANFLNLEQEMDRLNQTDCEWLHLDIMDGTFVPNISFGPAIVSALRPCTDKIFDVHLMLKNPTPYIERFARSGADYITVHSEADDALSAIKEIKNHQLKAGIALNPGTPVSAIIPLLDQVDLVLVMSVNPGFGGQEFIPEVASKINELAKLRKENGFNYLISVDGGVNQSSVNHLQNTDVAVIGSFCFQGEYQENIDVIANKLLFMKKYHPTDKQLAQLDEYAGLIKEYNQVMNLTGIDELGAVYLRHFYDSMSVSEFFTDAIKNVADLGSGAGFPGLVLSIMYPEKKFTLIEPLTKRCKFLQTVVDSLKLENVTILNQRMEDVDGKFDLITARAVAQLNILTELAIPKLSVGGLFVAMKASKGEEELKTINSALAKLSASIDEVKEFDLPKGAGHRINIGIKKDGPTNPKYPRNYSQIKKKPL